MQVLGMANFSGIIPLAQAAASAWIASAWEGLAIASILALCLKLFPRVSAGQRFAVWAAGFVVIAGLPFFPSMGEAQAATSFTASASGAIPLHLLRLDVRWSLLIATVWAAGSVIRAAMLATQSIRLRRLWREAQPINFDNFGQESFAKHRALGSLTGLGRGAIEICTTARLDRPSVIGFFSPRILIPDWLLPRLTAADLEQIVLHETQHIRRFDDWTNLLQKLFLVAFPLNPALLWIDRRLSMSREMACDEGVVQITRAPRVYATFLAGLAQHGLNHKFDLQAQGALALGAWRRRSELAHRVHSILRARPTLSPVAARRLLAAMTCGLVIGAFELAQCPQLVAFVPATSVELAGHPATKGFDQPISAHLSTLSGYTALEAKAIMPAGRPEMMHAGPLPTRRAVSSHLSKMPASAVQAGPDAIAANILDRGVNETTVSQKENLSTAGYIVYTSFEQVTTLPPARGVNRDEGDQAQLGDVANRDEAGGLPRGAQSRATIKITITRLTLRVVPTDSNSKEPSAAPVNHGWFDNQL
jgi:beta-lactamase regulating signal transducer with metallopeptidase domain